MKVWILNDYNHKKYYFYNKFIDQFKKERNINVEIEIKSRQNLWNEIFNFFENPSIKLADIIEIPHQWTTLIAKLGLALPLTSLMEEEPDKYIYPFLKSTMVFESTQKYFSLPIYFELMVMFYKKSMLDFIDQLEMKKLKWNDIFTICEKLKKKYRNKNYYPFDNPNLEGYITSDEILACVMNRTSGYFSSDLTMINIHRDEVVMSVLDFLDLAKKGYYPLFEENFFEIGFIRKNLSSLIFSFRRDVANKDMNVVRFPDIMRKCELARSTNMIFFSGTNEIDEVKLFIKDFYTRDLLLDLASQIGAFAPFKNSEEELLTQKEIDFYKELFEKISFIPNISVYPTFENMMNDFLKKQALNIINSKYNPNEVRKRLSEIKVLCEYIMSSY